MRRFRSYFKAIFIGLILFLPYFIYFQFFNCNRTQNITVKIKEKVTNIQNIYKIIQINGSKSTNLITIVSIFFSFEKSKHTKEEYKIWCETFLKSISSPLVAFIDYKSLDLFNRTIREQNLTATFYVTESIWDIMRELEIYRNKSYIYS